MSGRPALFLDRDGVLCEDRPDSVSGPDAFIRTPEELILIPSALRAAAALSRAGLFTCVVTNQSGLARGYVTPENFQVMMAVVEEAVSREGGRIDAVYHCPHLPGDGCACRKPKPGMLLRAARDHSLDLSRSVMVGDSERDLRAGREAGCAAVLVLTGKVRDDRWRGWAVRPDLVARDLEEAAPWIQERALG